MSRFCLLERNIMADLTPPNTGSEALNEYLTRLQQVVNALDLKKIPEEGWSLTDLRADVSEVISDKRDIIDVANEAASKLAEVKALVMDLDGYEQSLEGAEAFKVAAESLIDWYDQNEVSIRILLGIVNKPGGTAELIEAFDTIRIGAAQSASAAKTSETNAKTSATNAKTSETTAKTSATNAKDSETAAARSKTAAATSATNAKTSETNAATSATNAANSATASANSATDAANSANSITDGAEVATSKAAEAAAAADRAEQAMAGKADLIGGKVPTAQLPEISLTKPFSVASRTALLALDVQEGDVGIITAGSDKGSYILGSGPSKVFSSWIPLAVSADAPVQSVNGQTGTVVLSAANVGAAPTSHTHTASQISGLPSTDGGYNTRDATDPASSYPAGVDVSLNNVNKGWSSVIGAASLPSLGSYVVVTTVRQGFYNESTWQYLSSCTLPGSSIYVRKWQNDAWTTLRRLTDDGHTHTSAQISDATSLVTESTVVRRDSAGDFYVKTPTASTHPASKTYVDSGLTNTYTAMYKRPALFSGAGNPPSSIPGAVVGDYWLNETTMQLRKITGV
ncbi:gp40 [Corynebacterium phage P1201]|uniref:Gp40 n=1 Tax=Corynebacterium phage P1201 TaxID=384848 RepID=A7IYB1_9CAUD|nr:tail protein [Corynebacterium phage P1201]ABF57494.1 gp40 [Corynebacterium phage P1201]